MWRSKKIMNIVWSLLLLWEISDGEIYSGAELTYWTFQWDLRGPRRVKIVTHVNGGNQWNDFGD